MTDSDSILTSNQVVPNPTGKGGFIDHPENRSDGRWNPKNTFSFQMNRFKNMTIAELEEWNKTTPKNTRTVAEDLAFRRVLNATDRLDEFKEVADRTEGKAVQRVETKVTNIEAELEKLETNYDELAKTASEQMVADDPPVQNQK